MRPRPTSRGRLLALSVASALAVPVVLVAPVVTAPTAAPHPVKPKLQRFAVTGVDTAAEMSLGDGTGSTARTAGPGRRLAVLTSQRATAPFRLVGLTWTGTDPASMHVRLRTGGVWSSWETLSTSDTAPDPGTDEYRNVVRSTEPLLSPGSDGVQVRVDTVDGRAPAGLAVSLVDPGTSAADGATPPTPPSSAEAAAGTPAMVTRAQWGADETLRDPAFKYTSTVEVAFVHHTASSNSYWERSGWTMADAARDIRAIYAYAVLSEGYADVPYNFLVDYGGRVYEGRAGGVTKAVLGAATGGFNTDTMSVSALGNFATARPSSALVVGIERLLAWKLGLFHRDPLGTTVLTSTGGGTSRYAAGVQVRVPNISGHRDVGATACPGAYLYPYLPGVRSVVRALQQASFYDPAVSASIVPSTSTVTVATRTSTAMRYVLQAVDSTGHAVRTVTSATTAAAPLRLTWGLLDDHGTHVPDGSYTLVLSGSSAAGAAVPVQFAVLVGKLDVPTTIPLDIVYWVPGVRTYNGRQWRTTCDYPSLSVLHCAVQIWAAWWVPSSRGGYISVTGWKPYDYSFVAYDSEQWSHGITGVPGAWTINGRQLRTTCTRPTGSRMCKTFILASVVIGTRTATGWTWKVEHLWRLSALTYLVTRPAVPPPPAG